VIDLLQHLVHGVSLGAIYALIALGYTMVYGVLRLISFARRHLHAGRDDGLVCLVALDAGGAAPHLVRRDRRHAGVDGHLRHHRLPDRAVSATARCATPKLNSLITAIGFSFLLEYGGQFLFGPNPRAFAALPISPSDQFRIPQSRSATSELLCVGVIGRADGPAQPDHLPQPDRHRDARCPWNRRWPP
jgi:branched-chain amino acid transport system permease protein